MPPGLQYVFMNGDCETPVIISDKLSDNETRRLVATLKKYQSVISYSLKDLKGISLSLCTDRIPMEQEHQPVHEHQRRLNNTMREVVKKEVLKPLKAGVIYPVSDSEWVSPVQVVLKKGGMTVIHNGKKSNHSSADCHRLADVHRLLEAQQSHSERSFPTTLH
jgi:hypothetical protein